MTTELEQEFFKVFKIEPLRHVCYRGFDNCIDNDYNCHCHNKKPCKDSHAIYPEITDRKLLQLLCIYNDMQDCIDLCITPCKYEDIKETILQILIDEKTNITDYEKGTYMDVMTKQIQQLFKEEE